MRSCRHLGSQTAVVCLGSYQQLFLCFSVLSLPCCCVAVRVFSLLIFLPVVGIRCAVHASKHAHNMSQLQRGEAPTFVGSLHLSPGDG